MHQTEAPDKLEYVVATVVADDVGTSRVVEYVDTVEAVPGPRLDFAISVVLISSKLVPPSTAKSRNSASVAVPDGAGGGRVSMSRTPISSII